MWHLIEEWNSILNMVIWDNTVKNYLEATLNFLVFILLFSVLKRLAANALGLLAKKTANDFDDFLLALFSSIGIPVFTVIALYFASLPLQLSETLRVCIRYLTVIVVTIRTVRLMQRIAQYGIEKFYTKHIHQDNRAAQAMARSISGIANIILWGLALIFILDNMGVNVSALVAGIGIGGVAVALASQAVLGDAFSAVTIFFDKPFEVGDFIIFDNYMGTVEQIGIRTTRIRSLWGEQLIIANSDLTKSRIKNFKRMEGRYTEININVPFDTPLEKAKKIPDMIAEIFKTIPEFKPGRIDLKTIGPDALVFEFVFSYNSPNLDLFMQKQQELLFKILESLQAEGISLAYPTRTIHQKLAKTPPG